MLAFDADVLIYAATPLHPAGQRIALLFSKPSESIKDAAAGVGSVLLLPEILSKSIRDEKEQDIRALSALLARLDLRPVDAAIARLATAFAATYRLKATDAVHLATAVQVGADGFLTNNSKDFSKAISEISVVYPSDLPLPA